LQNVAGTTTKMYALIIISTQLKSLWVDGWVVAKNKSHHTQMEVTDNNTTPIKTIVVDG
jgi:hypothetical protein